MVGQKRKGIKINLTNQILIAMAIGIFFGVLFGERIISVRIIGDIFLRLIQMSVIILIMGAVMEAIGKLKLKELQKIGLKILFWFAISTVIAAIIGCVLGIIFQPGNGINIAVETEITAITVEKSIEEMIVDFFPINIVKSMTEGNMIQVIIFSVFFGIGITTLREKNGSSCILDFLEEFNRIILEMIGKVMKMAPLGVGALIAATIGESGLQILLPLLKFLLIMACGSFLYLMLCFIVVAVYCKTSVWNLCRKFARMTLVAFTTTSSAVTLPVQMKDCEEKLGVSKRISDLVTPLGMTLNSNGLTLFLSLAAVTIAQLSGVDITVELLVKTTALASLACLGTIVVPGGGIVALSIIVPALGLPMEGIAIMAGIDWFSGMFRTVLNVDADALVAMIIAKDENELDYGILNDKIGGEYRWNKR